MKELIECRLTKEQLKVLDDTFCVYKNGTKTGEIPFDCNECILREIDYIVCSKEWQMYDEKERHSKKSINDLCFAIYHGFNKESKTLSP